MPKVYNKYHGDAPADAVYIGRPSKWGNPFLLSDGLTRKECLDLYRQYLDKVPKLKKEAKKELAGKDLVCFCAPRLCHGDILLEVANS